MSQRIVTECDECAADGVTRDGVTREIAALDKAFAVDLCDEHVKPLLALVERWGDMGRPVGTLIARATCPRCGRDFATAQALGRHAKKAHGERVHELRKAANPAPAPVEVADGFACPECGKAFPTTRGLGAHRFRSHGVKGVSYDATRRRAQGEGVAGE
jgi:uncharacterized C2H2 Zn-finger protein